MTQPPQTAGAPWGSTSQVPPDAGFYSFVGFPASDESPAPLQAAAYQVPGGGLRPGNNTPLRPSATATAASRINELHALCVPETMPSRATFEERNAFREYYYWGSGAAAPQQQAPFCGR